MDGVALSPQQRTRWLADAGRGLSTLSGRLGVEGPLDAAVLRAALDDVVRRHDVLRTSFDVLPGMKVPLQVVLPEHPVVWEEHDLSALPGAEREERLAALIRSLPAAVPEPELRAALVRLAEDRHALLLTLPSVWADRRSFGLLRDELAASFRARRGGGAAAGEDEPMQYWQYSGWLDEILAEEEAEEGRRYWRGDPPATRWPSLPFAPPRAGRRELGSVEVPFGAAAQAELSELKEREAVSPEAFVLACWQAVLARFTGEAAVEVGCVFDGREFEELQGVPGPFARVLPVRAAASPGDSALDAARAVEEVLREHFEWQRFFEEPALPDGGAWRPPYLFEATEAAEGGGPDDDGEVRFGTVRMLTDPDSFDLKLRLEGDGEPGLTLLHQADRVSAEDAEWLASGLGALLQDALRRRRAALGDLSLLNEDRRREVLALATGPAGGGPRPVCVHEVFAARAEERPAALAVEMGDTRWTYGELAVRARRLAERLRPFGGPEARIGLGLEISPEAVAAILGILEAGAAYVPVDPFGPVERSLFQLHDAGCRAVITRRDLAHGFDGFVGEVIRVDDLEEGVVPDAGVPAADPAQLAYVIYTSGSTGRPKGVAVEHSQLVHYLDYVDRHLLGDRLDGCPLVSPLTFDASLKQIFVPLLRGTSVRGLGGNAVPDPAPLLELVGGDGQTAFNGTPSLWRIVLEEIEHGRTPPERRPRVVFLGGERVPPELLERSFAAIDGLEIWNLYGPTETTANAAVVRLERGGPVTIGRPRPDLAAHPVDDRLNPVPPGVPGELCLGGDGVARGYLGRPGLTAEHFVPDPYSGASGRRLYRTGDMVRMRRDGNLEFLGRRDHQVKLRGYRIELGEIEAVLEARPGVREAVAMVEGGGTEGARLVAYLSGGPRDPEVLRQGLRETLPEHMVPESLVVLEDLPRLASGKVDRRALASLGTTSAARRPYVAPRNELEKLLVNIWSEVLATDRLGVDDDFFDLGGHSIQSIRIVHRIREAGYDLGPRDLLQNPTVARLAAAAGRSTRADTAEYEEGSL